VLSDGWAVDASFCEVTFESALSLRTMIGRSDADLCGTYCIKIRDCDCDLDFPGCSVDSPSDGDDRVSLVRKDASL
jgi:hypothetical protein